MDGPGFAGHRQIMHDLRTPLSSIRLNLQRVLRYLADRSFSDHPGWVAEALELCLLEVARLDEVARRAVGSSAQLEGESTHGGIGVFRADEALDHAVAVMRPLFEQSRIQLCFKSLVDGVWVRGRRAEFVGALLELLGNAACAVRAEPIGVRPTICLTLRHGHDPGTSRSELEIHVADNGPGVPSELRGRVFDDGFTTRPEGSGIGLAGAQAVLRSMGGDLELCTAVDRSPSSACTGANFVLRLPIEPSHGEHPTSGPRPESADGVA